MGIENKAVKNVLIYVAKNTVSACFGIVFIYTAELLPTTVRSSGIGLCSLMARLGALFSPLLELLAEATSDQVPMFILGGFAVSSGLLTMAFLPETLGAGLPEEFLFFHFLPLVLQHLPTIVLGTMIIPMMKMIVVMATMMRLRNC